MLRNMKTDPFFYWPGEEAYVYCLDTGPRSYILNNWYRCDPDFLRYAKLHRVPDLALLLARVPTG